MKDLKKLRHTRHELEGLAANIDRTLYPDLHKKLNEAQVIADRNVRLLEINDPMKRVKDFFRGAWT